MVKRRRSAYLRLPAGGDDVRRRRSAAQRSAAERSAFKTAPGSLLFIVVIIDIISLPECDERWRCMCKRTPTIEPETSDTLQLVSLRAPSC